MKKSKTSFRMPFNKLFYADETVKNPKVIQRKLLKSEKYLIQGKPDYIFQNIFTRNFTPLEIKSGAIKDNPAPKPNDLMQLACYFLIIEENFGKRPKRGKLLYNDYMFTIKNTNKLRKALISQIKAMDEMANTGIGTCEPSFIKCKHCVCRTTVCEFV